MSKLSILLGFILFYGVFSCKHKEGEYHSLNEKIEKEGEKYHDIDITSEAYIGDIETIEVKEGKHTFLIPERKSQIKSFACTECHSKPLSEIESNSAKQKAHWDLKLMHADENAMNCATCHNGNDMNNLNTLTGNKVDFNMSFKLCAQCHSNQFEDWKGGAHGKNIGGWSKPRAAMTCVNCHNPHEPQIDPQWPVRFNTQKVRERK